MTGHRPLCSLPRPRRLRRCGEDRGTVPPATLRMRVLCVPFCYRRRPPEEQMKLSALLSWRGPEDVAEEGERIIFCCRRNGGSY